jgi:hypothetical protein
LAAYCALGLRLDTTLRAISDDIPMILPASGTCAQSSSERAGTTMTVEAKPCSPDKDSC